MFLRVRETNHLDMMPEDSFEILRGQDFGGFSLTDDGFVETDDPVGVVGDDGEIMADDDHSKMVAMMDRFEQVTEKTFTGDIDSGDRFIEK